MKTAKRWIVSAGACLLALTSMSVSFGQIPTAPIPEQNNDGLPLLTEPAPLDVAPIAPMPTPAEPEDVPAPVDDPVPQTTAPKPIPQPEPISQPEPVAQPVMVAQPAPLIRPVRPCQQCCDQCPAGAYYTPNPYYGMDTRPWWLNIRPVPYTPVGHEHHGMGHPGLGHPGFGGNGHPAHRVPIEPPFYTTRGPRDFYLDKPRPLGY